MTGRYPPPRLLAPGDDLDGFECRSETRTQWLRRHARQAHSTGTTRVFVARSASQEVTQTACPL